MQYAAAGFILGVVFTGWAYAILNGTGALNWIYSHETLSGSFLAMIAAILTVFQIRAQIDATQKIEHEKLERSLDAARANLPMALSYLNQYVEDCLRLGFRMARGENFAPHISPINREFLETITRCVEFASKSKRNSLIYLLREIQVQRARLEGEVSEYVALPSRPDQQAADRRAAHTFSSIYSSFVLIFIIQETWAFALNSPESEEVRPRRQRVRNAFIFQAREAPEDWPSMVGRLERTAHLRR